MTNVHLIFVILKFDVDTVCAKDLYGPITILICLVLSFYFYCERLTGEKHLINLNFNVMHLGSHALTSPPPSTEKAHISKI